MKNLDNKVAVSPSTATICSADGQRENAERKTPEQIALEIQSYFAAGGTPQQFMRDTEFIAAKIREAIQDVREISAETTEQFFNEASPPIKTKREIQIVAQLLHFLSHR